jgi:hypothetical protein
MLSPPARPDQCTVTSMTPGETALLVLIAHTRCTVCGRAPCAHACVYQSFEMVSNDHQATTICTRTFSTAQATTGAPRSRKAPSPWAGPSRLCTFAHSRPRNHSQYSKTGTCAVAASNSTVIMRPISRDTARIAAACHARPSARSLPPACPGTGCTAFTSTPSQAEE